MPAATGKRRRAEKAAATLTAKSKPNAAAADIGAAASSKKRASACAEPSRTKETPIDAASLDLDAFLNGGFLSVVPTPQGKGGIALTEDDASQGAGSNTEPKPRRSKTSAASKHRADLEALKTKDPEFFEYLKQADAELLDFAGEEEDEEEEEEEGSDEEEEEDYDDDTSSLSGSSDGEDEEEPAAAAASSDDEDDEDEAAIAPASPTAASADLPTTQKNKKAKRAVVPSQILRWCSEAKETLSLRAFKYLLQAYRAACHHGEASADAAGKKKKQKQKKKRQKEQHGGGSDSDDEDDSDVDDNSDADEDAAASAALASGAASNALLLFVLREADGIFRRLLSMPPADEKSGKKKPASRGGHLNPRSSPKWKKVEPLARSYLGNSLHLLSSAADPAMEAFVLRRLRPSAFLLVCSERLQRKTMKAALAVFGADVSSSAGNAATAAPLQAALFVREAAAALPSSSDAFDAALKGAYRAFVKAAKFVTPASAPRLALMSACVVDLYASAPPAAAYAAAFGYVRQLAQLVRGALDAKAKEGYRSVYCWQTVSCLELWARLLASLVRAASSSGGGRSSANGNNDDDGGGGDDENHHHALEPLVFPVIQLLLTSASLVPSLRYAPLHLRLLKAASDLGAASGRFVPVAAPLLDLLDNVALAAEATAARGGGNKKGGGGRSSGGGGAPQRHASSYSSSSDAFLLRASKVSVASATWQADIAERACEALASASAAAPWPTHPAFPEMAAPTIARLRSFSKNCGGRGGAGDRCRSASKGLVAAMEANVSWVGARRAAAALAPADAAAVAAFVASASKSSSSSAPASPPPLRAYADLLAQKARDKREMATAAAVRYGGAGDVGGGGEFGDEEDDGLGGGEEELLAEKAELGNRRDRRSAVQHDEYSDDDDDDDDDDDEESDDEDDEERAARYGESGSEDEVIEGESGSDDDDADDEQDLARITKRSCHVAQEDADDEDGLRDYNPSDSD